MEIFMAYIKGENREQLTLTPLCLDDYVNEDNICRVIDVFVRSLDMTKLCFKYAQTKETGRPPHDPAHMLMLYLYGYLNRIRSSRRLEAETHRNVEVMWLMEKITPDDKTICNFRKDNPKALKKVFRQFSLWCSEQGLYGKELVAVDGSKIRANSSRRNIHTQKGTEKELASVEKKISEYMDELERNDNAEADNAKLDVKRVAEVFKHLNKKKETLQDWLRKIEENDGKEISTVDPDAHIMRQGGDGRTLDACYNVQSIVDERHKLIVDFEVSTCPDDKGALPKMTESAKDIMGVPEISVVADRGYYDGGDIAKCEHNGTICYVPKMQNGRIAPDSKYDHEKFNYDKETDSYICPEGQRLLFKRLSKRGGGVIDRLYENPKACKNCHSSELCTVNKLGRKLYRAPNQDVLDVINIRMQTVEARQLFRERKKMVEHPFGTTKHIWGFKQFLCRGQEKTTAEQSLTFFAYNFRRVFNIFKEKGINMLEIMA